MITQPIANIAEIFARKFVNNIILSPGSRCAPLTLSFVRHPEIEVKTISDERSAAFIALGIAQQIKNPVGLVCTSGSSAYNYAPAVAEAYFQQVPLLILTADRPPEWIDQQDGQTIRQFDLYHNHIKKSYELPVSFDHKDAVWHSERIISEAINLSKAFPPGPVHINVPLREPLYPEANEEINYSKGVKTIEEINARFALADPDKQDIIQKLSKYNKILVVAGQASKDDQLLDLINSLIDKLNFPLVAELISNLHPLKNTIIFHDLILGRESGALSDLQPDLLITFGKSVLSKNLKKFLRKYKPEEHWHVQEAGQVADVFQSLTKVIRVPPFYFFSEIVKKAEFQILSSYADLWHSKNQEAESYLKSFFKNDNFGEFETVKLIMNNITECSLHFANSMAVRYGNFIGLPSGKKMIEIFANRGTSGIDGSNSTAVGSCFASKKLTVLITGDMAFFYDRNAFWHNYSYPELRIVVLNNHAGGIFRIIDSPAKLPELEEFFETYQPLTAKSTAEEFKMDYYFCQDKESLEAHLPNFFRMDGKVKILEVQSLSNKNHQIFNAFKNNFNRNS
ncbi:2-succinyl-5-enolpyruvyl-6-hydroxy-3-cyclohexene-1-carboxylic-acid synthase [soil metagenome]